MPTINLTELVDALQCRVETGETLIDASTGQIHYISDEALQYVENNETGSLASWQQGDIKLAQAYFLNPSQFISLPSVREVDEYRMIVDFAAQIENDRQRELLLSELNGPGVFRRFKGLIRAFQLEQAWYDFRDERYCRFAQEWCQENGFSISHEKRNLIENHREDSNVQTT